MELSERIENLGGGGGAAYAGYGGIGLFLLAIFLIILFAAFRQHNNGGDLASAANVMGEFHPRENCADQVRYDQLICKAKAGGCKMDVCGTLCLRCSVRIDDATPRLLILTDLPSSSYAPVTAAAGGGTA